jgi:hypothetical protein
VQSGELADRPNRCRTFASATAEGAGKNAQEKIAGNKKAAGNFPPQI